MPVAPMVCPMDGPMAGPMAGASRHDAAPRTWCAHRDVAADFEGLPLANAATTIYMATGLCQRFGLDSFYAVQNASLTDSTNITVNVTDTP